MALAKNRVKRVQRLVRTTLNRHRHAEGGFGSIAKQKDRFGKTTTSSTRSRDLAAISIRHAKQYGALKRKKGGKYQAVASRHY